MYYVFFFNDTATTEIYTLSLHDGSSDLEGVIRPNEPLVVGGTKVFLLGNGYAPRFTVRDGTGQVVLRARSEEHTSELQSRQYLVCRLLLEKKKHTYAITQDTLHRSTISG